MFILLLEWRLLECSVVTIDTDNNINNDPLISSVITTTISPMASAVALDLDGEKRKLKQEEDQPVELVRMVVALRLMSQWLALARDVEGALLHLPSR